MSISTNDLQSVGRKLDALIKLEMYNLRLSLRGYSNGDSLYEEAKQSIDAIITGQATEEHHPTDQTVSV